MKKEDYFILTLVQGGVRRTSSPVQSTDLSHFFSVGERSERRFGDEN